MNLSALNHTASGLNATGNLTTNQTNTVCQGFFNRDPPPPDSLVYVTYKYVIPTEMLLGFIVQSLNLVLLTRSRIRGLRYTVYLRALCITYLINIPLLVPAILQRNNVFDFTSYPTVFYLAHFNFFLINLFLQTGNLLIVALSIEPLRALLFPFKSLRSSEGGKRNIMVVCSLFVVVIFICIPMIFLLHVVPCPGGFYAMQRTRNGALMSIRQANAVVFELVLIIVILVVYTMLFLRYMIVRKNHVTQSVNQSSQHVRHQRATAMCLGSITAFLLCNLPSAIYEVLTLVYGNSGPPPSQARLKDIANMALILTYTLNFLMQCIFSDQYRRELMKLVRCNLYNYSTNTTTNRVFTGDVATSSRQQSMRVSDNPKKPSCSPTPSRNVPPESFPLVVYGSELKGELV